MKMRILISILLMPSLCFGAQVIRYVDTSSPVAAASQDGLTLATAYDCLKNWESTEQADLDTANNYMTVYCSASGGIADTNELIIDGWTTSATDYIEIIQTDFPANGVWSDSVYRMTASGTGHTVDVRENYVRIYNLQAQRTCNNVDGAVFWSQNQDPGNYVLFDSCIAKCTFTGPASPQGFSANPDADPILVLANCIVYETSGSAAGTGVYMNIVTSCAMYNCTVYGFANGTYLALAGTCVAKNCIVCTNTNDNTNFTFDYCATDDGDGTNALDAVSGDWDNELQDANNGDFRIVEGGNCDDGGTDNPGSGLYTDDITGTARVSAWDVGAYEVEGAAPASGQVFPAIMVKAILREPLCLDMLR